MNPEVDRTARIKRLALVAAAVCAFLALSNKIQANLGKRDYLAYWTAGQLLVQHQNPYSANPILEIERRQGFTESKALVLRTPPWSLFIMLPLGFVGAYWGWFLWMAISVVSLMVAIRICWRVFGRDAVFRPTFWMVGYTFAPVLACLVAGQLGILLLLGMVLFLVFEQDRPFVAGAALILPFAKPHLLPLFWLVLLLWVVAGKRWAVAGGFSTALAAATFLALAFDPAVFRHYGEMLRTASIGSEFIPALAGVLRLLLFPTEFRVQFVPSALGSIWAVWYYLANRFEWDWRQHGATLMIASLLITPYAWFTDEVVVLPVILQVAVRFHAERATLWMPAPILFAFLNGLLLVFIALKVPMASGRYFWSSLLWLFVYTYGRREASRACQLESKALVAVG